jgi:beta-lactamase superfamily II metal-dependent hydrolase
MLIRSQDKETLINFNNSIVVNTMVDIGGVTKMFCSYSCDDYVIGHYSSKEKAMKVLDMIQEAYCEFMAVRNGDMWCGKESVFQMPEDSEVEA